MAGFGGSLAPFKEVKLDLGKLLGDGVDIDALALELFGKEKKA